MKKIPLYFSMLIFLVSGSVFSLSQMSSAESADPVLVAYYFHGNFRCATCQKLEQFSKKALDANFKSELESGKLQFKAVNVDDKGNEHYSTDYKLYTKSLVLSLVKDGKESKWKNLDKIWEYVGDQNKYIEYVKTETAQLLKEAS